MENNFSGREGQAEIFGDVIHHVANTKNVSGIAAASRAVRRVELNGLRVPAVYPTPAFLASLSNLSERGMNKLRVFIGPNGSIPTAPTKNLVYGRGLNTP